MIILVIELLVEFDMFGGVFVVFVIVCFVVEFLIFVYIGLYIGFMIDSRGFFFWYCEFWFVMDGFELFIGICNMLCVLKVIVLVFFYCYVFLL